VPARLLSLSTCRHLAAPNVVVETRLIIHERPPRAAFRFEKAMTRRQFQAIRIVLPIFFLAAVLVVYWPGLHGAFLFDDYGNLPILGETGPIDNWPAFWRYITSGTADPIGRPLTLLTFLIDAHDWPADPFPFKRTNLLLHLLNGALLMCLLCRLGRAISSDIDQRYVDLAGWLGAVFWLVHPLFLSTTLYIVQREAMLPATFTLLGLLSWLHGRRLLLRGQIFIGFVWITWGLGGCTALAVLSKANGMLLPSFSLVIEYSLLRSSDSDLRRGEYAGLYRNIMLLFAWLPTTVIITYLLKQGWIGFTHGVPSVRPWTLGQRLLTEPRVLMRYLDLLWLPRPFTPGLFNDDISTSVSLTSPATTLPALSMVIGLIVGAWKFRHRWPAIAAAVLFYFVGQSIESTTIPLELYFEHRNYLPAMLMFWPLALWLCGVRLAQTPPVRSIATTTAHNIEATHHIDTSRPSPEPTWRKAKLLLAAVLFLGLGLTTYAGAQLWGNVHDQALLWAALNPKSPRAQSNAATAELNAGHPELAVARLRPLLSKAPDQVQLALNLFGAECQLGNIDQPTLLAANTALRTTRDTGNLLAHWFERAMAQAAHAPCPQLNLQTLRELLNAAEANPYLVTNAGRQQDLLYLQGRIDLLQGDANAALVSFNHALDKQVREPAALEEAALLGSMGFPQQGLAHLDHYEKVRNQVAPDSFGMPRIHAWILGRQQYWPKELAHLRAALLQDAKKITPNDRQNSF